MRRLACVWLVLCEITAVSRQQCVHLMQHAQPDSSSTQDQKIDDRSLSAELPQPRSVSASRRINGSSNRNQTAQSLIKPHAYSRRPWTSAPAMRLAIHSSVAKTWLHARLHQCTRNYFQAYAADTSSSIAIRLPSYASTLPYAGLLAPFDFDFVHWSGAT